MHNLSNILILLDGVRARAMSNCVAYHQTAGPDGPFELIAGGRYLDNLEKRGGEWRIAARVYVLDWNRSGPSSHSQDGLFAQLTNHGARYPDDLWYRHGAKAAANQP